MSEKIVRFGEFKKGRLYSSVENPYECLVAFSMLYLDCEYSHSKFDSTQICLTDISEAKGEDSFFERNRVLASTRPSDVIMKLDLRYLSMSFNIERKDLRKDFKRTQWEQLMNYNYKYDIVNDVLNKELFIEDSSDSSSILCELKKTDKGYVKLTLDKFYNRQMKYYNEISLDRTIKSLQSSMGLESSMLNEVEIFNCDQYNSGLKKFIKGYEDLTSIMDDNDYETTRMVVSVINNQRDVIISAYEKDVDYEDRQLIAVPNVLDGAVDTCLVNKPMNNVTNCYVDPSISNVSNFKIHPRALTYDEIKDIYENGRDADGDINNDKYINLDAVFHPDQKACEMVARSYKKFYNAIEDDNNSNEYEYAGYDVDPNYDFKPMSKEDIEKYGKRALEEARKNFEDFHNKNKENDFSIDNKVKLVDGINETAESRDKIIEDLGNNIVDAFSKAAQVPKEYLFCKNNTEDNKKYYDSIEGMYKSEKKEYNKISNEINDMLQEIINDDSEVPKEILKCCDEKDIKPSFSLSALSSKQIEDLENQNTETINYLIEKTCEGCGIPTEFIFCKENNNEEKRYLDYSKVKFSDKEISTEEALKDVEPFNNISDELMVTSDDEYNVPKLYKQEIKYCTKEELDKYEKCTSDAISRATDIINETIQNNSVLKESIIKCNKGNNECRKYLDEIMKDFHKE